MMMAEETIKQHRKRRMLPYCALGAMYLIFVALGAIVYVQYNEAPGTEYVFREARPHSVKQGETAHIAIRARRFKVCETKARRTLVGGTDETAAWDIPSPITGTADTAMRLGEYNIPDVTFDVPESFPPGPAKFRAQIWWRCNPVQKWFENYTQLPDVNLEVLSK